MKISKSKDFGFSYVALKGNNAKEFLLHNRKTVWLFFIAYTPAFMLASSKNLI
jgi:hypothetical protein